jgi:hypothetical protein
MGCIMCSRAYTRAYNHTHIHTCMYTHVSVLTYYIHTHTYIYIYIHAYIHSTNGVQLVKLDVLATRAQADSNPKACEVLKRVEQHMYADERNQAQRQQTRPLRDAGGACMSTC